MPRVLVTGGAGFIGSTLVDALLKRGYHVRVLDNLSTGNRDYLSKSSHLEFIEGDVTDIDTCYSAMKDMDGVFHLAAMSKVLPSFGDPAMISFCINNNVLGTQNILQAALANKHSVKKLIYSASSTYYGTNPTPHRENQVPCCQSPYAATKYMGEMLCNLYSQIFSLPTVCLRYFMVYGPRQPSSGPYAIVTGIFMQQAKQGAALTIHGDGSQSRDFVHVEDVVEANIRAFESNLNNKTLNVGRGEAISIQDLADIISENQIHQSARPHDMPITLADTTQIMEALNWVPDKNIFDYLKQEILLVKDIESSPESINSNLKAKEAASKTKNS